MQPRFFESGNKRVLYSIPLKLWSLLKLILYFCVTLILYYIFLLTLFNHKNIILRKLVLLNIKRRGHRGKEMDQTVVEDEVYHFWSLPTLLCQVLWAWHDMTRNILPTCLTVSISLIFIRERETFRGFVSSFSMNGR